MNGRYLGGLFASMLALTVMACTGGPLSIKTGPDGRPGGTDATPKIPSPSPFTELETPDQPDEPVMDPVPGLASWAIREIPSSPRDQKIQRIFGAANAAGDYTFFLQQGEHFYYRSATENWSETRRLGSHRQYSPTRLFSDGSWLFFVNDTNVTQFSGEERLYQAQLGSGTWSPSSPPKGIVAVASGPGFAFAATKRHLYRWDGSQWSQTPVVSLESSLVGEEFVGLTVDTDSASKDLIILLSSTDGIPYRVKRLPPGMSGYASMQTINLSFNLVALDRPLRVYRSYLNSDPQINTYRYWGFSTTGRVYYGDDGQSLKVYEAQSAAPVDFTKPFKGFTKLLGRFYAYRNNSTDGRPEIFFLRDLNVSSRWTRVPSIQSGTDGSPLVVNLASEESLATDGEKLYAAGPEGLYRLPLHNDEPDDYPEGQGGWVREPVELNRAPVSQVIRSGSKLYAKTEFGTYTQKDQGWDPFVLGGLPATLYTSLYGHVATVNNAGTLEFYLPQGDSWVKVTGAFPSGVKPTAGKIFFSRDRLFVAASVPNGEAVYQRDLKVENVSRPWVLAAKDQGLSTTYPTYISDGRVVLAIGSKVRLASLTTQEWKDYPPFFVLPDGSTKYEPEGNIRFGVPFAVYGYAFVWVDMGGSEQRLCRATSKGWKPIVSDTFEGRKVSHVLSTDGHYLYSSTVSGSNTYEMVRVPIKDGTKWERVPVTLNGASLDAAGLKVNAPPFLDRDRAQAYLATSRGILGP